MESIKQGSFTVEAAFIMPVILAVLFGTLRIGLILHDEAIMEAAVIRFLEKGEMAVRHLGDMETGRPDYERIILRAGELEKEEMQESLLEEELSEMFLMKKVSKMSLNISQAFLEEKKIELSGNAGRRTLSLFYPAEHKRRISR